MDKKILNISYSRLFDKSIPCNTSELYETACRLGFDAIKGDVTPSSDGKMIMCHDSYFSFDENGRVLEPGQKGVCRKFIKNMTAEKCTSLEYAKPEAKENLGYYAKVTELEELIRICKKYDKIAYITVRDKQIQLCVDEIYRLLEKYGMQDKCIINSFTYETLKTARKKDKNIKLSLVFGPNKCLTKMHIDRALSLGNCVVCVFWFKEALYEGKLYEKSKNAISYAKEKDVEVHFAHGCDKKSYKAGIDCGFTAFQCTATDVLEN